MSLPDQSPSSTNSPLSIKTVAVIGAGQMGAGIAQVCAMSGFPTLLWDGAPAALNRGFEGLHSRLDAALAKGKMTAPLVENTKQNISTAASLEDTAGCDLIIEAIVENFEIKKDLFRKLDVLTQPHTILASNTSSISITKIAATTQKPANVVGIHFMNPVPVMKLVELIRGLQTSDETFSTAQALCERLGKTTVVGIDLPGFIINRILCPMVNEAIFLLQEGCRKEDIDLGMKLGTNHPMGPLELADFVGLDTLLSILQILHAELGEDKYRPCPLLIKYVEAGWYGRKVGRGFYQYS
jgi:3-hydroxybutyryl-CoA dehydrogenase